MENIYKKLIGIQNELKAPKNQYNSFGKYKYRSCEDILEALKPLLQKYETVITVKDDIIEKGNRLYVQATVTLINISNISEKIEVTAIAREEETKKGMDGAQVTGTSSSYARKYALNGMFCIDDTKDADTNEYKKQQEKPAKKITKDQQDVIFRNAGENLKSVLDYCKVVEIEEMLETTAENIIKAKGWK